MTAKSHIQVLRQVGLKMSHSHKSPLLHVPQHGPANAVEQAKCLSEAAKLVEGYAQKSAPDSLDVLLAAGNAETPGLAAEIAREAAKLASMQAETLLDEVQRFLTLTQAKPSN